MQSTDVDVILIYPKTGQDFGSTISVPHAVLALAAPLHARGYTVKIIDQRVEPHWQSCLQKYLQQDPICVGISTMTGTQIYFALEAAKVVREITDGRVPIVWGGTHPSILPEQTLENAYVDAVCVGEGEQTFLEMVAAYQSKNPLNQVKGVALKDGANTLMTPARPLLNVEELLPIPWELVDITRYIHRDFYIKGVTRSLDIGQTSRGCPFQCGFCVSATVRQRKWRAMSVEKSLNRILEPVQRFHLDAIWIRDDEFYIDRERTNNICEGILKANLKFKWYTSGTRVDVFNKATDEQIRLLKRSGADTLKFGAESGSNRILKLMNKGIRVDETIEANLKVRRFGIIPTYALMIGFPTETFEEINQTIDLFVRLKTDNPQAQFEVICPYTAFPGTPLYSLALEHGLKPPQSLEGWINWLIDEYDLEGTKMPWFNYFERKKIGNLAYMSILANAAHNAIGSISSNITRNLLQGIFIPISAFERFKLKKKWYAFAPELELARYLRKKLFYSSYQSIY